VGESVDSSDVGVFVALVTRHSNQRRRPNNKASTRENGVREVQFFFPFD